MQLSQVGGAVGFVVMLVAGLLSEHADSAFDRKAWYAVALLGFVGAIASQYLKGWIGSSYREMKDEIARLEKLMDRWERPDGSLVPFEERGKIQRRYQRLIQSIEFHPDNPRRY